MRHRGPDDEGWALIDRNGSATSAWAKDTVPAAQHGRSIEDCGATPLFGLLGHRRLSIIDVSAAGHQPMFSTDGRYAVVFNGEIYNYRELATQLEPFGRVDHRTSDTAVALRAFEVYGTSAFAMFEGMWAFAIWDSVTQSVILARDHAGIKPLFYTQTSEFFAFASEIKGLLPLPGISRALNAERAFSFLRWGESDYGSDTMFAHIRQLEPGEVLEISTSPWSVKRSRPACLAETSRCDSIDVSYAAAAEALKDEFRHQMVLHLRSDVSIGSALSGGIDSSSIVSVARDLLGAHARFQAVCYASDDELTSELAHAEAVSRRKALSLIVVRPSRSELLGALHATLRSHDEPFGSSRIVAQRLVYEAAARNGIRVMLNGQGADEVLAGYDYLLAPRLLDLMRTGDVLAAYQLARGAAARGIAIRPLLALAASSRLGRTATQVGRLLVGRESTPSWLSEQWFRDRGIVPLDAVVASQRENGSLEEALQSCMVKSSLPHLLRYEDRNSMACSIESRVPFLGRRFIEAAGRVPLQYLISSRGVTKDVFRASMRGCVPDQILQRSDKIGFETPERSWLESWLKDGAFGDIAAIKGSPVHFDAIGDALRRGDPRRHAAFRALLFSKWLIEYEVAV